jgi:hypothetical protein
MPFSNGKEILQSRLVSEKTTAESKFRCKLGAKFAAEV